MSTKFFTNSEENTLIQKFEGVFTYNSNIEYFDALVGYFRASGYFRVRPFLDKVPTIRVLVGINVDKMLANAQKSGLEFFKNHDKTKEEFIEEIQKDIAQASYNKDTEIGILQFIDDIVQKKIEVKAHPDKRIHAKVYIFRPEPFNEHTYATVITGSSNFTDAGLAVNYEFNVQLSEYTDVRFATDEFEKLWADSVDILPVDLQGIKKKTYLNEDVTPFELYIKLLTEYFGKSIEYDPDSVGDLPQNFKKLSYQIDAVNEGFNMLTKHNGFILADVVGLGKTVIAAMVAKKFLLQNGKESTKILVVYPPAVEKNWKATFKNFDLDRYTKFITNGSLDKILTGHEDYWNKEEYDLIIADEAHKFRNHTTGVFQNLQLICKSPRNNRGLIEGLQKKVILVSATPLNNRPDDIFYQIQMFQDARQSTLDGVANLTRFFSPLMEQYKDLKRFDVLDVNKLREIYGKIRKNVIQPITVRRTRKDLENINTRYYPVKTLANLNLFELTSRQYQKVIKDKSEWKFINPAENSILKKVEANSISLKEYTNDQIYFGIKTGFNEAFELTDKDAKYLLQTESKDLVKKFAKSTDISKYSLKNTERYFLVTGYDLDIIKKYPSAYNYLKQFEDKLSARQDKGKNWWNLRACKYYSEFEKTKLIYIYTAKKHEFYLDTEGRYINNNCYMIVSDDKYLFGYLNSKLFEWYKRIKFVAYGDAIEQGRVKLDYNKMITVPIKNTTNQSKNKVSKLVDKILSVKSVSKDVTALEQQIDNLVYKLYELTYQEVKAIDPEFALTEQEYTEIKIE
jgi:HKD family nuclease